MHYLKPALAVCFVSGLLLLSGCGNNVPQLPGGVGGGNHYVYKGHDFGPDRDSDYRTGVVDGCRTTEGDYTKNHALFKTNESYRAGWEHGRLHCKGESAS